MKKFCIFLLLLGLISVTFTEMRPELTIMVGSSIVLISLLQPAISVIEIKEWCRLLIDDMEKIFYTRSINWRYSLAPIRARGPTILVNKVISKISSNFRGLPCQGNKNFDNCQEVNKSFLTRKT